MSIIQTIRDLTLGQGPAHPKASQGPALEPRDEDPVREHRVQDQFPDAALRPQSITSSLKKSI